MDNKKLVYRTHAVKRMISRRISESEIEHVINFGDVIENYSDDKPYPSKLIFALVGSRPIHVVLAENSRGNEIIIITVYEPDFDKWESDYERRKK